MTRCGPVGHSARLGPCPIVSPISIDAGVADVRLNRPDKRNALDGAMFLALGRGRRAAEDRAGPALRRAVGRGRLVLRRTRLRLVPADGRGRPARDDRRRGRSERPAGNPARWWKGASPTSGSRWPGCGRRCRSRSSPPCTATRSAAASRSRSAPTSASSIRTPSSRVREVHWGLVPDMTGTLTLSRLVRPDVAKELTFTGRMVTGARRSTLGLATRLSETPRRTRWRWRPRSPAAARDAVRGDQGPVQPAPGRDARAVRGGAAGHRRLIGQPEPGRGGDGQLREAPAGLHRPTP